MWLGSKTGVNQVRSVYVRPHLKVLSFVSPSGHVLSRGSAAEVTGSLPHSPQFVHAMTLTNKKHRPIGVVEARLAGFSEWCGAE